MADMKSVWSRIKDHSRDTCPCGDCVLLRMRYEAAKKRLAYIGKGVEASRRITEKDLQIIINI